MILMGSTAFGGSTGCTAGGATATTRGATGAIACAAGSTAAGASIQSNFEHYIESIYIKFLPFPLIRLDPPSTSVRSYF